jgi:hypothetical protein
VIKNRLHEQLANHSGVSAAALRPPPSPQASIFYVYKIKKGTHLSVLGVDSSTDAVYLFVDFRAVVVALLTCESHGELDTGRMPSDFAQTLASLAGQFLGVPTKSNT